MALPVIAIRRSTDEHEAQTRVASERVRVLQDADAPAGVSASFEDVGVRPVM